MPEETYIVSQGDSIPSIAKRKGFFWKTIWNHGNNAALKSKRKNPNVLFAGDEVYIPALQTKSETKATDARHKFKRKGEPVQIAIKLFKSDGTPRSNIPYVLEIENKEFKGNTDGDGQIKQAIPNDARSGMVTLTQTKESFPIAIGGLDPVDEVSGVQQRLNNLGFDCPDSGTADDATARALENFQSQNNLNVTGKIDDATKNKLLEFTQ